MQLLIENNGMMGEVGLKLPILQNTLSYNPKRIDKPRQCVVGILSVAMPKDSGNEVVPFH